MGTHRYEIHAVDKGGRISAVSAPAIVTFVDPNAVVDNLAPTVPAGTTATRNGASVTVTWSASTDLPDPGGVGVAGYYVVRDWFTQWFVPAGTTRYVDTTAGAGAHRYEVHAVDRGNRISGPSAPALVTAG
ncbi:MAG: hypothetical protein U0Q22_16280 [Acidimicrobiales bacterium]